MINLELRLLCGGDEWWFGKPGYWWTELRDANGKLIEKRYIIACDKVKGWNAVWDLVFELYQHRNDWWVPGSINLKP